MKLTMNKNLELKHVFGSYLQKYKNVRHIYSFNIIDHGDPKSPKYITVTFELHVLKNFYLKSNLFQNTLGILICSVFNLGCIFWYPCHTINLYNKFI